MNTEQKEKNYKVYVVGSSTGYARWIEGELVDNMNEADIVLLTGGEDISPSIYNEPIARPSSIYLRDGELLSGRDAREIAAVKQARELHKPIWGTCRGAQMLCALAGGKLVQDMQHWGTHKLFFNDSKNSCCSSNSLHHQLQYPYTIDKRDYSILAYSEGLSPYYHGTAFEDMEMPELSDKGAIKEPEFIYYNKLKGLGIQGHPEMMDNSSTMVKACRAYLDLLIEGKLDSVLKLNNLSLDNIIERSYKFKFTAEELMQLSSSNKRKAYI